MNSKKIIEQIANKLGMKEFKFEETEIKLAETVLQDGTVIYSTDALDLGVVLYTDSEMTIVIADGSYETADGVIFEVIDGVVGVYESDSEKQTETDGTNPDEHLASKITLGTATLKDGTIIYWAEGDLVAGIPLFMDPEMTESKVDGEWELEDGRILVVTDGILVEIKEVSSEEVIYASAGEEFPVSEVKSIETVDGERLFYSPELELAVDTRLFTDELMETPAEETEYSTVDGLVLTLNAGIITNIVSIMEAFKAAKEQIRQLMADIEDQNDEVASLTEANTKLSSSLEDIKVKMNAKPAVETIKYSKVELSEIGSEKISKNEKRAELKAYFNQYLAK